MEIEIKKISNIEVGLPLLLTRTMYCPHCEHYQIKNLDEIYEREENIVENFVLFGQNTGFKFNTFNGLTPVLGMTPHLVCLQQVLCLNKEPFVIYSAFCAISGCGISLNNQDKKNEILKIEFRRLNYFNYLELDLFNKKILNYKNIKLYI
jgi:hypothetical protein